MKNISVRETCVLCKDLIAEEGYEYESAFSNCVFILESKTNYKGFTHLFINDGMFCVGYTEFIGAVSVNDFSSMVEYSNHEEALHFFNEVWK